MEKSILIRLTEEEHNILKEKSKNSRQSITQYILSKTIDEDDKTAKIEEEIKFLKQKLQNRELIPSNARSGI